MDKQKRSLMRCMVAFVVLAFAFAVFNITPVFADDASDTAQLVVKSELTMKNFLASKALPGFRDLLGKAKGVLISPEVLEGAFVFGASGGSGVLVVRDAKTGVWKGPAFYTIGEVSFGLQIGGKASQVIMLAMTDRGVNALLSPSVKLGADVGVAAGPVGVGAAAATANISADILVYALSKGLFAGISLNGAVVGVRNSWNEAYYGKEGVTTTDILILGDVKNPASDKLLKTVTKGAKPKMAEKGAKMKPAAQGEGDYYTVQAGDSLSKIAAKHGTTVAELVKLNQLKDKKLIYQGQKLLLPPGK